LVSLSTSMQLFVFFFQAEDGIRVFHVTGVQTCALPIYREGVPRLDAPLPRVPQPRRPRPARRGARDGIPEPARRGAHGIRRHARSEEHTSELQSRENLVCRPLLEKKKTTTRIRCRLRR